MKRRFTELPPGSKLVLGDSLPISSPPQEVYGIEGATFLADHEVEYEDWVNEEEEEVGYMKIVSCPMANHQCTVIDSQ